MIDPDLWIPSLCPHRLRLEHLQVVILIQQRRQRPPPSAARIPAEAPTFLGPAEETASAACWRTRPLTRPQGDARRNRQHRIFHSARQSLRPHPSDWSLLGRLVPHHLGHDPLPLHRLNSVVFGTVLSGCNLPITGVQDTIGPLINVLPFHADLDCQMLTCDFLYTIFAHSVQLALVQSSLPNNSYSRHFTLAIAMEFQMEAINNHLVCPVEKSWSCVVPNIPLSVYTTYDGTLHLCFCPQQYYHKDIQLLADHFQNATLSLLSDQTMGQSMAGLMTNSCRDTLMQFSNCNNDLTSLCSIHNDLVTLFKCVVCNTLNGIAVEKASIRVAQRSRKIRANPRRIRNGAASDGS